MGIKIEAGRDVKVGRDVVSVDKVPPEESPQPKKEIKRKPLPWRAILSIATTVATFFTRNIKVK